jgi:hypothetical protein
MMHTIDLLPSLCAPGATVVWTRHRRAPDATPAVRARFARNGFEELAMHAPEGTMFGVGVNRLATAPMPFEPGARLFTFLGYGALAGDVCSECGFSYAVGRAEITPWLRADARTFVTTFERLDTASIRTKPAPDVWSPLEYACHVRDVLRVQRDRVELALREDEPDFAPMFREQRVVDDRYNEQDPATVARELLEAGEALTSLLDGLDDAQWLRTGIYNYPEPAPRTIEWVAIHTTHELLHHRGDLTRS